MEGDEIISSDKEVANIFNSLFTNTVINLNIEGYKTKYCENPMLDKISNIVKKTKIIPVYWKSKKTKLKQNSIFPLFSEVSTREMIKTMDTNKPSTYNNIPTKILIETNYIISLIITEMYNESKLKCDFPHSLKLAEITPAHKKDERTMKNNYRPVSILPAISKIFEKNMYNQIYAYIDKYLSPRVSVHNTA